MTIIIYTYHDNMIYVLYYICGCKLWVRYKTAVRNKNKRLFKELVLGMDTVCKYLKKQFDDNPNNRNEYKDLLTYLIGRRYFIAILFGLKENQDWMKKSIAIEEFEKNCLLTIDDLLKCEDNEE